MSRRLSRLFTLRLSLGSAVLCAAGAATLAAFAPAVASSFIAAANSLVTCATTTACVAGTNTAAGSGVSGRSQRGTGVSASSVDGFALIATSTNSGAVVGTNSSFRAAVSGYNTQGVGVQGVSSAAQQAGVYGEGPDYGVLGRAAYGYAVYGETANGSGFFGNATGYGMGSFGYSKYGYGVYAQSTYGTGLRSDISGGGFSVVGTSTNGMGAGADFEGGRYGIVGRANSSGFPLVLTDSSYNNVFYVSGTGDVYLHGQMHSFLRTAGGATVSSYTPKSSQPTVEDTGTAQLTAGAATVMLDPTFAATIDQSAAYRVFLTPDGDTHGLFVAQKTPRGFSVRETQGGHSTLAFDYRIVATGQGQVGKRMMLQPAAEVPSAPSPPAAAPARPKPPKLPSIDAAALAKHPNGAP